MTSLGSKDLLKEQFDLPSTAHLLIYDAKTRNVIDYTSLKKGQTYFLSTSISAPTSCSIEPASLTFENEFHAGHLERVMLHFRPGEKEKNQAHIQAEFEFHLEKRPKKPPKLVMMATADFGLQSTGTREKLGSHYFWTSFEMMIFKNSGKNFQYYQNLQNARSTQVF